MSRTKHYFVPLPRHQCSGTKCEYSLDSKGSVESQASSGFHSTRELVLSSNKITMNNHTLIEFSGLRDSHSIHPTHGGNRLKCHLPFDKIQYAVFFLDIFTFKNWRKERDRGKKRELGNREERACTFHSSYRYTRSGCHHDHQIMSDLSPVGF